jgi:hypothetical protein
VKKRFSFLTKAITFNSLANLVVASSTDPCATSALAEELVAIDC